MLRYAKCLKAHLLLILAAGCLYLLVNALRDGYVLLSDPAWRHAGRGAVMVEHSREDDPQDYWMAVGMLGFWGAVLFWVALQSYRDCLDGPPRLYSSTNRSAAGAAQAGQLQRRRRQRDSVRRRHERARALDPLVRSALDRLVLSLSQGLALPGIGWRELDSPQAPDGRAIYIVLPALSDLDRPELKAAGVETLVRDALRDRGYPPELLARVSVHLSCPALLRRGGL